MSKIKTVIIAPMQSIGRCGKSTFMQCLAEYLKLEKVQVGIVDADGEHKTLSSWFPKVAQHPFTKSEDLMIMLNGCGTKEVELVDFPAQATEEILSALNRYNAEEIFKEKGVQLLIPIFASSERVAMHSASLIYEATNSFAKYIVVKNSSKYESGGFFASERLSEIFGDCQIVDMPPVSSVTIAEIDRASKKEKRALTFKESAKHLAIASRMEIETWINKMMAELEKSANELIPNFKATSDQETTPQVEKSSYSSPFDL